MQVQTNEGIQRNRMKALLHRIILPGICVLILASLFYSLLWENEAPVLTCTELPPVLGDAYPVECTALDAGSGIRCITVSIEQDGIPHFLTDHFVPHRGTRHQCISFQFDINHPGIHDGQARLVFRATDYSFSKNVGTVSSSFVIDTTPPRVTRCNTPPPLRPGDTSFVAYRLSEVPARSGVLVNEHYFPSFPDTVNGEGLYVSCFALPLTESLIVPSILITAEDKVGNIVRHPVKIAYAPVKYRHDDIVLSDTFFTSVILHLPASPVDADISPPSCFHMINESLREKNMETVCALCRSFTPRRLWNGPFETLENAVVTGSFGDRRTYYYRNEIIGEGVHLGVDYASVRHAPVRAANTGTVVYAAPLGIFGNTVLIDHGRGLFSLYAHLSRIAVHSTERAVKGNLIGYTGSTGMSMGDHLHISMILGGVFVDPQAWSRHNGITSCIERLRTSVLSHQDMMVQSERDSFSMSR